ncbi:membrane fusion protein, multidrug efflux system [Rhizobiales bacterium GAS191]|nr:membrane fusion protein, multidrug efflux system [Rhizobiales bacterium GAS113]SEB93995.1 membrane fusion protein, multidrug efflux system [Rhizobiales bacterium GAS188]SED29305.1 membrane fusion protein, multidrug efflux system [Rhizobiales bacterium GAS191]
MSSWKRLFWGVVGLGAVSAAGFYVLDRKDAGIGTAGAAAPEHRAMPVPVIAVIKKTIPISLEYSGRTESIRSISLQARIPGYLQEQPVPDGTDVKAGDLLYKIDPRDFQATLDQTTAQAQRDKASLDYARANLDRGTELAKTGFVAKDTWDQRASAMRQAEAALAMDEAAIRTAQLNLSYAEIRAPFAGRMGRNQAPIGTLVSVAGTALNTLVQLDPIYVTFNPSETDLVEIQKARMAGKVDADILLSGEAQSVYKGELTFIDNVVDRATGTITARATIGNPHFILLPGQYVRVRLHIRDQPDALMVPQTALGSSQLGKYVYVVGEGNVAELRLVQLGPTDGPLISVVKGVSEGDKVIVGNLQKIGPGAPVQVLPPKPATGS